MLDISKDIDSLSSFKRNTTDFIKRMKKTRKPVVLTVNGKAELVVQDAESYQQLLDLADLSDSIAALQEAIDEVENGRILPFEEAIARIKRKHDLQS